MSQSLLTPLDISERLQVRPRTVYDYLAEGGPLYHLRIEIGPRIVRVDPEAFEAWIKQNATS